MFGLPIERRRWHEEQSSALRFSALCFFSSHYLVSRHPLVSSVPKFQTVHSLPCPQNPREGKTELESQKRRDFLSLALLLLRFAASRADRGDLGAASSNRRQDAKDPCTSNSTTSSCSGNRALHSLFPLSLRRSSTTVAKKAHHQ